MIQQLHLTPRAHLIYFYVFWAVYLHQLSTPAKQPENSAVWNNNDLLFLTILWVGLLWVLSGLTHAVRVKSQERLDGPRWPPPCLGPWCWHSAQLLSPYHFSSSSLLFLSLLQEHPEGVDRSFEAQNAMPLPRHPIGEIKPRGQCRFPWIPPHDGGAARSLC